MVTLREIAAYRGAVALTAHGNRHRIARRRAGNATAEGLIHARFGVIDEVVACKGVDNDLRQHGIHQQIRFGRTAVAHAVGAANGNGVKRVRQIQHVGNRHWMDQIPFSTVAG